MGGMHTRLWGEMHPDFMDALCRCEFAYANFRTKPRLASRHHDAIRDDRDGAAANTNATASLHCCGNALVREQQPLLRKKKHPPSRKRMKL